MSESTAAAAADAAATYAPRCSHAVPEKRGEREEREKREAAGSAAIASGHC